jgi:hypothetical protein
LFLSAGRPTQRLNEHTDQNRTALSIIIDSKFYDCWMCYCRVGDIGPTRQTGFAHHVAQGADRRVAPASIRIETVPNDVKKQSRNRPPEISCRIFNQIDRLKTVRVGQVEAIVGYSGSYGRTGPARQYQMDESLEAGAAFFVRSPSIQLLSERSAPSLGSDRVKCRIM